MCDIAQCSEKQCKSSAMSSTVQIQRVQLNTVQCAVGEAPLLTDVLSKDYRGDSWDYMGTGVPVV